MCENVEKRQSAWAKFIWPADGWTYGRVNVVCYLHPPRSPSLPWAKRLGHSVLPCALWVHVTMCMLYWCNALSVSRWVVLSVIAVASSEGIPLLWKPGCFPVFLCSDVLTIRLHKYFIVILKKKVWGKYKSKWTHWLIRFVLYEKCTLTSQWIKWD